jgi:hypothetical protein
MKLRTGLWVTVIVVGIYAALGAPQMMSCLANGGGVPSCVITGLFLGALKAGFYIITAVISGLAHIFRG